MSSSSSTLAARSVGIEDSPRKSNLFLVTAQSIVLSGYLLSFAASH